MPGNADGERRPALTASKIGAPNIPIGEAYEVVRRKGRARFGGCRPALLYRYVFGGFSSVTSVALGRQGVESTLVD